MYRDIQNTGIYIHFPYCIQKCDYCDFYSASLTGRFNSQKISRTILNSFQRGILRELEIRSDLFQDFSGINSVYFGGGTASLLPSELISDLLEQIFRRFTPTPNCEITLEGNPEQFSIQYINELKECGVNRINVGIQTFKLKILKDMNRFFINERYENIINVLQASSIRNYSVDLMYGFPGQSEEDFLSDLSKVIAIQPEHLSIYALTIEPGTPLARRINNAIAGEPKTELQFKIFQNLSHFLAEKGYIQYEISNFSRTANSFCRHNSRYWLYESYLALGPGAHGFNGHIRYENIRNISKWENNPAAAALISDHNPVFELPLSLLRFTIPFSPLIIFDVLDDWNKNAKEIYDRILILLDKWVSNRYGQWLPGKELAETNGVVHSIKSSLSDYYFCWKQDGYLHLDTRISEMAEILSDFKMQSK